MITRLAEIQTRYSFTVKIFADANLIIPFVLNLHYYDVITFVISNKSDILYRISYGEEEEICTQGFDG